MAAAAALPIRGTVILASTWQLPSLWQRPPPSFLF
jgi:hypothetical protein